MNENYWIWLQLAQERERDLMRQLQHNQLVREAQSLPREGGPALYHLLDRVGQHLIHWGQWLRARHAAYHTSPNPSQETVHG